MTKESNKMKEIRQGNTYSINSRKHVGHKGDITKKNRNGSLIVVVRTHAPHTRGRKNILLNQNPQLDDSRETYILPHADRVRPKYIGTPHPAEKITNSIDKSIKRNLTKRKKRRG